MALDDRSLRRTTDEVMRSADRIRNELRSIDNGVYRLGQDFRNDQRFSSDAYRLKDELSQLNRDVERVRERVRSIQRNTR